MTSNGITSRKKKRFLQTCNLWEIFTYLSTTALDHAFRTLVRLHHHPAVCLTTGSKPLPKRSLHILRSRASSFKWEYPLLSLRSSSGFLRLIPCLLVTSISPFIFSSITCSKGSFYVKLWPIQLAFRFLIACRIFLCSLTWSNTSSLPTWSVQLMFSILLQHHISKLSRCFLSTSRSVQVSAPYKAMLQM